MFRLALLGVAGLITLSTVPAARAETPKPGGPSGVQSSQNRGPARSKPQAVPVAQINLIDELLQPGGPVEDWIFDTTFWSGFVDSHFINWLENPLDTVGQPVEMEQLKGTGQEMHKAKTPKTPLTIKQGKTPQTFQVVGSQAKTPVLKGIGTVMPGTGKGPAQPVLPRVVPGTRLPTAHPIPLQKGTIKGKTKGKG
jgi:hypothetical protein